MYIVLEYVTYIGLILVASTLLFGTSALFVVIREGMRWLGDFIRASVGSSSPAMKFTTHVAVEGRYGAE